MGDLDRDALALPENDKLVVGIACAAFNHHLVEIVHSSLKQELKSLCDEAQTKLELVGQKDGEEFFRVPGSLELAFAVRSIAACRKEVDVLVALGCVIRGDTTHYDIVCEVSAHALQRVSEDTGIPVINGIITCENVEQAQQRAESKGTDFARSTSAMSNLGRNPTRGN